jgi:hypothetical protein
VGTSPPDAEVYADAATKLTFDVVEVAWAKARSSSPWALREKGGVTLHGNEYPKISAGFMVSGHLGSAMRQNRACKQNPGLLRRSRLGQAKGDTWIYSATLNHKRWSYV